MPVLAPVVRTPIAEEQAVSPTAEEEEEEEEEEMQYLE